MKDMVHISEKFDKLADALSIADWEAGLVQFAECSCICEPTSVYPRPRGTVMCVYGKQQKGLMHLKRFEELKQLELHKES